MITNRNDFEIIQLSDNYGNPTKKIEVSSSGWDEDETLLKGSGYSTPSSNADGASSTSTHQSETTSTAAVIHQLTTSAQQKIIQDIIGAPLLQSGNNIAVLRHYGDAQTVNFDEVLILNIWERFQITPPEKIIVFDMDETFIMGSDNAFLFEDLSLQYMNKIEFLAEEYLLELMSDITTEKNMIVIVTKRFSSANGDQFFAALPIVQELERRFGKQIFSAIYFTNNSTKVPALEHLYKEYLEPQGFNKDALSFADDLSVNLAEANAAGFDKTIIAMPNGGHYDEIYEFATGKTRDLEFEENFENNPEEELSFQNFRL